MQDKHLIDRIKTQDDQEAFKQLIDKYKQLVFSTAISFLHNEIFAEDITQEVFIKFWEIRKDFELTAKFSTWLYKITINKCINLERKNKLRIDLANILSINEKDNELAQKEQNEYVKIAFKKAINSLPKKQRIAFILNKCQKFSYNEIADFMNLSLYSVESLLHRAKIKLQKKLINTYKNYNN